MKSTPYQFVRNTETGEVYQATTSSCWAERLQAWREAMAACDHDVRTCPVPSPMPAGHVMFLRSPKRRPPLYQPYQPPEAYIPF